MLSSAHDTHKIFVVPAHNRCLCTIWLADVLPHTLFEHALEYDGRICIWHFDEFEPQGGD